MILDIHADIFTDIFNKKIHGENNIIERYHLNKFNKGGINGGIFVFWTKPGSIYDNYKSFELMMKYAKLEVELSKDYLSIARNYSEYINSLNNKKITEMINLEGLSVLEGKVNRVEEIYNYGIRFSSLTWNEENEFACGVKVKNDAGLKVKGKEYIKLAQELGIVIDVSHASDKTFYDIYNVTKKPIIASHSNCRSLCNVGRNLVDEQLKLIKDTGGLIGINAYRDFIHEDKSKKDIKHLINHIDYMVDLIGIDCVCFGFDYCDYIESDLQESIYARKDVTIGLEEASKSQNIIYELKSRGYKSDDIEKLSQRNFLKFMQDNVNK
ncbi:MAG: membrane dipeptidase [Romboutsia sp.]